MRAEFLSRRRGKAKACRKVFPIQICPATVVASDVSNPNTNDRTNQRSY